MAVANLWDVTDLDIDRFAHAVLDQWLGDDGAEDAPLQREKELRDAASRSAGGGQGPAPEGAPKNRGMCIAASVAPARAVCRLRHLVGAAPVCYGVPTTVLGP